MIQISKEEARYLESKGAKFPSALHRTHGVGKKYYLTEDQHWLKLLNQRRNNTVNNN